MKRIAIIAFVCLLALTGFTGCASQSTPIEEGKISVIASFFPLYDFAKAIGGEHVHVVNMIPAGVEPHDWTPKSQDMINVSKSQLFIYQGAGFEGWIDELFANIDTDGIVIVEASKGIELMEAAADDHGHGGEPAHEDEHGHEEDVSAHEDQHGHEDEHGHEEEAAVQEEDGHDHGVYDPHTWLSPKSAVKMAENVKAGLIQADPAHAADYEANFETLADKLQQLDRSFTERLGSVSNKEIVVSHQAFGYMARDYGLTQLPMMGIAAEAEPTAQDLKEISEFVEEHNIQYIFTESLVSDAMAKTLASDLGIETLPLHTLEGLTPEETKSGETYITIMEQNLTNLLKALNP